MREEDLDNKVIIFFLGNEEYGIDIKNVREIIAIPQITRVPKTPVYILGIANYRGNVITVIDPQTRLNKDKKAKITDKTKMIVTEYKGSNSGIIIDSVSSVTDINGQAIEAPPDAIKNTSGKYVKGMVRLKNKQRPILILNLKELLNLSHVKKKTKSEAKGARLIQNEAENIKIDEIHLITFTIGNEEYAFDITKIQEIIKVSEIVRIPDAPDYIKGIQSFRESLLPVLDFRSYIGSENIEKEIKSEILKAKNYHLNWYNDFKTSLQNSNSDTCRFGKWLKQQSSNYVNSTKLLHKLNKIHNELHQKAKTIRSEGKNKDLNAILDPLSQQLIKLLTDFEQYFLMETLDKQRIIVIQYAKHVIGILVDSVREVLRINKNAIDKTLTLSSNNLSELEGIAKLDNGNRLIMIINEKSFFGKNMEDFYSKMEERAMQSQQTESSNESIETKQFVTFIVDNEEFGIDIRQIQEINRIEKITKLPKAPSFIEGIINLRGEIIPVIDLRKRFDITSRELDDSSRVIITDISGKKTGLIVDRVNEVLNLPISNIEPTPDIIASAISSDFIDAVGKAGDNKQMIMILNVDKILSKSENNEYKKMQLKSEKQTKTQKKSEQSSMERELKIEE